MTWPGWGDILPSVTLVATIAALLLGRGAVVDSPCGGTGSQRSGEAIGGDDADGGGRALRTAEEQ